MIKFRKNLYLSESINNVQKVKWKIRTGRGQFDVYLIVLSAESKKIEYFHNAMLKQKILFRRDMDVIGLAKSSDECAEIVSDILAKAYEACGNYDVYEYLSSK